jgi:hypothetical protein
MDGDWRITRWNKGCGYTESMDERKGIRCLDPETRQVMIKLT